MQILALWPDEIPADNLFLLRQLPALDLFVLVSRLGHPLPTPERRLARTLSDLATLSKVLFVGLKGEEAGHDDVAELAVYAKNIMQRQGFVGRRFLGSAFWRAGGGPAHDTGTAWIGDPLAFAGLAPRDLSKDVVDSAREGAFRRLVQDLQSLHRDRDRPLPKLTDEDCHQLTRDLDRFLTNLGDDLDAAVAYWPVAQATARARRFVVDAVRGWGAYISTEGHWLRHVETVRPGMQAALLSQIDDALKIIEVSPVPKGDLPGGPTPSAHPTGQSDVASTTSTNAGPARHDGPFGLFGSLITIDRWFSSAAGIRERIIREARSAAIGLAVGVTCYLVLGLVLFAISGNHVVLDLTRFIGFFLASVLGYAWASNRLPQNATGGKPPQDQSTLRTLGWRQFAQRITSWFSTEVRRPPLDAEAQFAALMRKLGLEPPEA